jgi:two-component system phosphate regulon sensor histidine kinase PhoR
MAISNHAYFDHYKRRTLTRVILVQIVSALVAGGIAYALWQSGSIAPLNALAISIVALIMVNIAAGFVVFATASKPHQLLSQAIAHVSKDPVVTPPPPLDAKKYERSGLKSMVQTVYELAVGQQTPQATPATTQPSTLFKELVDNVPCGLMALDTDGRILYANGLTPLKDMPDGTKVSSLQFEQPNETWLSQSEANKVRDTKTWQRVADKLPGEPERRIFDVVAFYQKDNPAGVAAIVVAVDRTDTYHNDQEDMDFIALAAHELRGPITVIRGYLDVVKNDMGTAATPEQQELFDRLQVSSERLAGYVNNILNVSRYDRHQFQIHLHEENIVDILKTLVPDLALRARTQHRALHITVPQGLPTIAADSSTLGEVITNLVDNAIKYSHENGDVTVNIGVKDDAWLEVTVEDHGIGIPESVVGGLFNKFYRSHRSRQTVGGTGLGLYICKAIVESHGGSIWVRSKEGQGSTFGFTVPIYATVAAKLQAGNNQSKDIVQRPEGWIKNHSMYRR